LLFESRRQDFVENAKGLGTAGLRGCIALALGSVMVSAEVEVQATDICCGAL
jgi:hypothetical protein